MADEAIRILLVDDNPGDLALARAYLEEGSRGIEIRTAPDGIAALAILRAARDATGAGLPDLVITDLHMPGMDGLTLVETLRREIPSLPVVLMTAFGSEEIAFQCLRRGAASYVPKREMQEWLAPTVQEIAALARARRQDERVLACCVATESRYILDNDPGLLVPLARQLGAAYRSMLRPDETDQFRLTMALHEALSNAIFHGNLEVSTALRRDPPDGDAFHRLAAERRRTPPYCDRRVRLTARFTADEATFTVRDQGPGFNVDALPDPRDHANLEQVGGRGLFLIRMFMDVVQHHDGGREIVMVKRRAR